jgi:DNA-binding transcriptional MerR regulator
MSSRVEVAVLIGELAERAGASRRSLRYYEAEGLLTSVRAPNGYRIYDDSAVTTVRKIKSLLAAGLPLDTVRQVLPCAVDASPRVQACTRLVATLRREIARLDADAAAIRSSRDQIAAILDRSDPEPAR